MQTSAAAGPGEGGNEARCGRLAWDNCPAKPSVPVEDRADNARKRRTDGYVLRALAPKEKILTKLKNKNKVAVGKLNEITGTAVKQVNEKWQYRSQCMEMETKIKNLKLTAAKADKIIKTAAKDIKFANAATATNTVAAMDQTAPGIRRGELPTFSTPTEDGGRNHGKSGGAERLRVQNDKPVRISISCRSIFNLFLGSISFEKNCYCTIFAHRSYTIYRS